MKRQPRQFGFTLMELVLVMVIAVIALGIAAPRMLGYKQGAALRGTSEEFLALARYSRTRAIVSAKIHRIDFDATAGKYQLKVQSGTEFVVEPSSWGRVFQIPENGKLELKTFITDPNGLDGSINFYPTGRTQISTLRISDQNRFEVEISCASPADNFRVTYEGTVR